VLILKIIFKKLKKHNFNVFISKKYFERQSLSQFQTGLKKINSWFRGVKTSSLSCLFVYINKFILVLVKQLYFKLN
jgi:hypothetical protein